MARCFWHSGSANHCKTQAISAIEQCLVHGSLTGIYSLVEHPGARTAARLAVVDARYVRRVNWRRLAGQVPLKRQQKWLEAGQIFLSNSEKIITKYRVGKTFRAPSFNLLRDFLSNLKEGGPKLFTPHGRNILMPSARCVFKLSCFEYCFRKYGFSNS